MLICIVFFYFEAFCSALFGVGKIMTRCPVQFDVAVPDGSVSSDVIVDAM